MKKRKSASLSNNIPANLGYIHRDLFWMRGTMKRGISRVLWMALVMASSLVPVRAQQAVASSSAPVPSQIISAKKVFISNAGGEELDSRLFFLPTLDSDQAYDKFYAAVKSDGRYEPVLTPADADLILEIRFSYLLIPNGAAAGDSGGPHLRLAILDPKTHVLLWAFSERVDASGGPHWKDKREKNFDQGIAALVRDITRLALQPAPSPNGSGQ